MLKLCENSSLYAFQSEVFFSLRTFCILKYFSIFFLLNKFLVLKLPVYLASPPSPKTEPAFDCFTPNQHSFIKKLLISFSVTQSTDYCDDCKTFRASPHFVDRPLDLETAPQGMQAHLCFNILKVLLSVSLP